MKKLLVAALTLFSLSTFAQEDRDIIIEKKVIDGKVKKLQLEKSEIDEKVKKIKQRQEIIIRSKGDNNKKVTVEINGDKITINGKPVAEFKDDDITINKRNITIFDGKERMPFDMNDMEVLFDGPMKGKLQSTISGAFLGVTTAVINENKNDTKPNGGAIISNVSNESAAEKAGLKEGDIITKVDSKTIENPQDLTEAISSKKPKDEVTITYKRDGKVNTTKATLGERKGGPVTAYSFSGPNGMSRSFSIPRTPGVPMAPTWEGKEFDNFKFDFNDAEGGFDTHFDKVFPTRKKIGLKIQDLEEGNGVKVIGTDEESPAEKAGIKKDDIITEINDKAVNNTDDARELLKPEEGKNNYTIKAKRNGTAMSFDVKIPKKLKTANL
ncbi:MAG: PDZ domain-containing protein [Ferruginibacter sp.]|nr:PDZ domain-containing protein [Ferruginibacter sp.]